MNWLSPLGADPNLIVAELNRINPNVKPTVAQGQQVMDAVVFHPETSQRRALILAPGHTRRKRLSPGEREPLTGKLLDLYRNDPDSGIHGAVEWTLRKWGRHEKVKELDAELMKLKDRGDRRWFVNSQGQTYSVIEGPVEFRMGSPPNETDRDFDEIPHQRIIPRRFAIATQEVTVEQYQGFVKENPADELANNDKYSPDPKGPMNGVSWYHAAAYCNWMSRKENLPECYEPNERGQYAAGMRIKPDTLRLDGYRLPTEVEWEYGCRAGAGTSRYYGSNVDLMGRYAWHSVTSPDRTQACGSLLPNDLGLFDMLGNIYEWCQDKENDSKQGKKNIGSDILTMSDSISEQYSRLLRGSSFHGLQAYVRSAFRISHAPSNRNSIYGFRPARTCH